MVKFEIARVNSDEGNHSVLIIKWTPQEWEKTKAFFTEKNMTIASSSNALGTGMTLKYYKSPSGATNDLNANYSNENRDYRLDLQNKSIVDSIASVPVGATYYNLAALRIIPKREGNEYISEIPIQSQDMKGFSTNYQAYVGLLFDANRRIQRNQSSVKINIDIERIKTVL